MLNPQFKIGSHFWQTQGPHLLHPFSLSVLLFHLPNLKAASKLVLQPVGWCRSFFSLTTRNSSNGSPSNFTFRHRASEDTGSHPGPKVGQATDAVSRVRFPATANLQDLSVQEHVQFVFHSVPASAEYFPFVQVSVGRQADHPASFS
jgi:hypothetical protein